MGHAGQGGQFFQGVAPRLLISVELGQGQAVLCQVGQGIRSVNDHDFELVPAGVNKGRALALLALMWGIPLERCAAVGDSANDLEMLQAVGCPIAMGNAAPQVQAAAVRTVADNGHDGAAQAILSCLE